jgi:UDPglucose--hexose-1-phosphate uridylyltransferase
VVYAGHRNSRPWTVPFQEIKKEEKPHFEDGCYLCPGNERVGGMKNPAYEDIFVFDNDHPVVGPMAPEMPANPGFYEWKKAGGLARVICYSPRHDLTMAEMPLEKVKKVFRAWKDQTVEMAGNPEVKNLLIFENKGEMVGVSNHHPHGQLYATDFELTINVQYLKAAKEYKFETGKNLFQEILKAELEDGSRIICQNDYALAILPFFARYAYETLVFPKKPHATMETLSEAELDGLAEVYHTLIRKMDGLFGISFPYVMTINQAPFRLKEPELYQLHWQILPPLRQPNLKKFPAGPEIGSETFMADTIPEEKAKELREVKI